MNATTYGLHVAKRVFQMHWVDVDTGEIVILSTTHKFDAMTVHRAARRSAIPFTAR